MAARKSSPIPLKTVLVPLDLTPGSEAAISRVGRLPVAEDARVTLLHVVPRSIPSASRARAVADARHALGEIAARLAPKCGAGVEIECEVRTGDPSAEIGKVGEASSAQLVVMGRCGTNDLREMFVGSTAERVVRGARLRVLVVLNRARQQYARPLLAVSGDEPLPNLLKALVRLMPAPRPPLAWVHAFDPPYHGLIYPSLTPVQSAEHEAIFERKARAHVRAEIDAAIAKVALAEPEPWRVFVLPGSPRRIIPSTVSMVKADLLAMCTQARAGLSHALLGTVAGDVLREVPCDVLVVPPRRS